MYYTNIILIYYLYIYILLYYINICIIYILCICDKYFNMKYINSLFKVLKKIIVINVTILEIII